MKTATGTNALQNNVTAEELGTLLNLQLDALLENPTLASTLPPLFVWGAPGLGKSSLLRQVAASRGIGFIDVRLAQREPVDIRGLPVPGKDGIRWLVASEWPRDPHSRGIILFDELTASDRSLQVAAYEFILDRRLGELYQVPDGWYICAAGNRTQDRAVATTISSALANRFLHVELRDDVESWIAWALGHEIHPSVVGFIRYRPACLFNQTGENLERGWPSPRSWERVSLMLKLFKEKDRHLLRKVVYGLVGDRAGVEFMEYLSLEAPLEDTLRMMLDSSVEIVLPESADRLYALTSAMVYLLWRAPNEEEGARRLDGFFRIGMALPPDFATMAMMDAMGGGGPKNSARIRALSNHASYKGWIEKFGSSMHRHLEAK